MESLSLGQQISNPEHAPGDHSKADMEGLLHLLGINNGAISLNESGIFDSLASRIFLANGSIIETVGSGETFVDFFYWILIIILDLLT